MGLPKDFNNIIESQLNIFAAWLPLTNIYELGDYGVIADGVFAKMGNIKEFDVEFTPQTGNESKIDFTSASTSITNFSAGGKVDVIPEGSIDAKVTFKFEKGKSFLIKSPSINITAIGNINQVGEKLMVHPKWQRKFKVVYQTYFAKEAAIMSTINAGTEITFSGDVKALQKLNVGNASLNFTSSHKLGLDQQGKEGVIGLGLFQIVRGGIFGLGDDEIKVLAEGEKGDPLELKVTSKKVKFEDDL
ncbi:MAG TPA: hypothetical protein VK483_03120 [Chitinophagaceae bacterium]|nr:hypothetical protein [Chitinophagaceae bacterium]